MKLYGTLGIENPFDAIDTGSRDPHPLVRFAAAGALPPLGRGAMAQRHVKILAKLVGDTSRLVRAEAGRVAAGVPDAMWSPADRPALLKARGEFLERERANEERPDAHVTLAIDAELMGDTKRATAAYEQALKLAPGFVPAHLNLATLLARDKQVVEAEKHLRAAVQAEPTSGPAHYALGLLLLEAKRPGDTEALAELRHATQRMPTQARPLYTLGLVLDKKGDPKGALGALTRAQSISPADADLLYALAFHHASHQQTADAKKWLERLRAAHPDDRRLKALGKQLDNAK
jgi:Tfp pilus assembly protein PilF